MKCRSVACLWPITPPSHRITAAAVLNHPPTLYTGGSDGSIIWWTLSTSESNSEVKPVAMLCGHGARIADLAICHPVVSLDDKRTDNSSDDATSYGALFSACLDGVLCVWSRGSGHCRRRRKLPPWVGSPSIIRTLPTSSRYVCICSVDAAHSSPGHSTSVEGSQPQVDEDVHHSKPTKCTVVVVDSYSLTIVQTVFHGVLSIGQLKFMDIVLSGEDGETHSVLMADSSGKVQLAPILKDSPADSKVETALDKNLPFEEAISGNGLGEGGEVVSVATHGNIVALVLQTCCLFRQLTNNITIGQISFVDQLVFTEGNHVHSIVLGGTFLKSVDSPGLQCNQDNFLENFVVWNSAGAAIVYLVSYLDDIFKCEPLCKVPGASHAVDTKLMISFVQLKDHLIRFESVCFNVEEPLHWQPHFTVWSLLDKQDERAEWSKNCQKCGESDPFSGWISGSDSLFELNGCDGRRTPKKISPTSSPSFKPEKELKDKHTGRSMLEVQTVSSSMVISENLFVPYAIVYGYFNGEIEVVRFDMLPAHDLHNEEQSLHHDPDLCASRQYFTGHTGAVLCLAAHRLRRPSDGCSCSQVLVSGSSDCTIRIWDLDGGNPIIVMHHHVAPVRQIIFPPAQTEYPWSDCFLSVGEDSCIALASLQTLKVERMFPGHPSYPEKVVWDGLRGYVASLCHKQSATSHAVDVLYIWDVKSGAQERVLRGAASHSMLDHFCKGISASSTSGSFLNGNTSVSALLFPIIEDGSFSPSHRNHSEKKPLSYTVPNRANPASSEGQENKQTTAKLSPTKLFHFQSNKHPIRCTCPFPGIASLSFDLSSLISSHDKQLSVSVTSGNQEHRNVKEQEIPSPQHVSGHDGFDKGSVSADPEDEHNWTRSLEVYLLRFSLSFLHSWDIDSNLDRLLIADMKLRRPANFILASGLQGDKGSLTLTFPGSSGILEMWKSSSEFCAMRSLTMVSIAQRMISLSRSSSVASSALAAFYTRGIADKVPDTKPPLLQLLASFWQDESEHVRMAARSIFHCAASRAIPLPLSGEKAVDHARFLRSLSGNDYSQVPNASTSTNGSASDMLPEARTSTEVEEHCGTSPDSPGISETEKSRVLAWLESFEVQDWISCVGGTSQDAMTSHIIVAAALAVWYPSMVKPSLASLVVHPLIKLVMAMSEKYSSTAAELLAEGIESTWKACCGSEIARLIGDIFFQVECVSGTSANPAVGSPSILETLVEILLPSLAMADVPGFLAVIESQIWSTASDSPVHQISLTTLMRVLRGSPKQLTQHLEKVDLQVVTFILHTIDPSNSVMRKLCLQTSMTTIKEVARVFPMVALNETSRHLAVGDAIGEINNAKISLYDMLSVTKIRVLDASGPPGLPNLLSASQTTVTTLVSALSFSPNGEGLVAFSEHGLMIRYWSLGSVWWEKLSRNVAPLQCTKVIFVPPWEGFSPHKSRSSVIASIMGHDTDTKLQASFCHCFKKSLSRILHMNVQNTCPSELSFCRRTPLEVVLATVPDH
ncbi:unnamed protein product [Linum tenue]|uniref:Transducin/WD40 repeat-like superfamily protein n=1 Tax=Linum tenue TaxID=586396 RepID=A0AAV0K1H0_9ROSI|nr:unnamed protein product [Linum tenue]